MITKITPPVSGITCTGCESSIWFTHKSLEGARQGNTRHWANGVEVYCNPGPITVDGIRRAVRGAGYRVVGS